jgi:hypothetical protein
MSAPMLSLEVTNMLDMYSACFSGPVNQSADAHGFELRTDLKEG